MADEGPKKIEEMTAGEMRARLEELAAKYKAKPKRVQVRKPIDQIARELAAIAGGWPCRLGAAGDMAVELFVDMGGGTITRINTPARLKKFLHEYCRLQFNGGQDDEDNNYVTLEDLYEHLGTSELVREYVSYEEWPHEPPMAGTYYAWRPPADGYEPDGRVFAEFVAHIDNIDGAHSRAVFAAAALTVFWGGYAGSRPAFIHRARVPGCGKTQAAELIGRLCGGALMINLGRYGEDRLKERFLSPVGLRKRTAIVDNLKVPLDSAMFEELVSARDLSGKKLAVGEASRPNTITYFVTANDLVVGSDAARRCFFADFLPFLASDSWQMSLDAFLEENRSKIIRDALWILRQPKGELDFSRPELRERRETYAPWITHVLARGLACGPVKAVVEDGSAEALTLLDVVLHNIEQRNVVNEELQDAGKFLDYTCESVLRWMQMLPVGAVCTPHDVFIPTSPPGRNVSFETEGERQRAVSNTLVKYWLDMQQYGDTSSNSMTRRIERWCAARYLDVDDAGRRVPAFVAKVGKASWGLQARGFVLRECAIRAYIRKRGNDSVENVSEVSSGVTD